MGELLTLSAEDADALQALLVNTSTVYYDVKPPRPHVRGHQDRRLLRDKADRVIGQRTPPPREPTVLKVELQQQYEPQPGRTTLARHQDLLVIQQCPLLDQLVEFDRPIHER